MKKLCLTLSAFLLVSAAEACSCNPMGMRENFKSADYVVQVSVLALNDTVQYDLYSNPLYPPFLQGRFPKLRVIKSYKGPIKAHTDIAVAGYGSMCDYFFRQGQTYIVFLNKDEHMLIRTSSCAQNFLLSDKGKSGEFKRVRRKLAN